MWPFPLSTFETVLVSIVFLCTIIVLEARR